MASVGKIFLFYSTKVNGDCLINFIFGSLSSTNLSSSWDNFDPADHRNATTNGGIGPSN